MQIEELDWLEAFPFLVAGELPEGEKVPPRIPSDILESAAARQVYSDGSFGGLYRAPQAVGHGRNVCGLSGRYFGIARL